MLRKISILLAASALALGVGVGHSAHALAAPGSGGGASMLAQFCQQHPGMYPEPASTQGACVSYLTSGLQSIAYAPSLCAWIASTYLGNGYGFDLVFYDLSTNTLSVAGPVNNQGQCVSTIAQNATRTSAPVDAFYPV